ncbi:MAG TPA: endosialidase [Lachnospiraceae bacterium]
MSVVKELIKVSNRGGISFGDYTLSQKGKKDDFDFQGDKYKVRTHGEITKLEKNGMFIYESVPGTSVHGLKQTEDGVSFFVEGNKDAQITLELAEDAVYLICLDGKELGEMKTNLSGKLSFSIELEQAEEIEVLVKRV